MPRIDPIDRATAPDEVRRLIELADRRGAPDARILSVFLNNETIGRAWADYWNELLYAGQLPHRLKEACRILISVAHQCGYCSTVRSTVAAEQGLTEDVIAQLPNFEESTAFSPAEKQALRFAAAFKSGEDRIDSDEMYAALREHFTDAQIVELGLFCGEVDGAGKFARSVGVVSWEDACALNPALTGAAPNYGAIPLLTTDD